MQGEGTWSSLPDLLLWMIKDKLDIFDNMQLAAVCRGWRSASTCYPKKLQSVGDGFPWIMQWNKDCLSSGREFVGVLRTNKFSLDLPEFCGASVLFSKQGWMLMLNRKFSKSKRRLPGSLFLINCFTKSKIKMPDPDLLQLGRYYCGSFSILDGYPNCVVLLDHSRRQVTVRVAYPGDEAWTKHSYLVQRLLPGPILNVVIVNQDVYCIYPMANMITYNISSHIWKEIGGSEKLVLRNYVVEHEGNIFKLVPDDDRVSSCTFFRYNGIDASWEKLSIDDVKGTSWFLSRYGCCFSTKDKGLKVYFLCPSQRVVTFGLLGHDVLVHDLMEASTQTLELLYTFYHSATWVDIG